MAAGSTGSGKSIVTLGILHILCSNLKNVRFAVIRKSEKNLLQTSIPSYSKVKEISKSSSDSTITNMTPKYKDTGSEIVFVWADTSKDPDLNNIKGLELTGALIEEANQIDEKYFSLLKTRIGRWNNEYCPQFIMLNMNPSAGWCKDIFYDNWANNTLQEGYFFSQFDEADIKELISSGDLSEDFIEGLEDMPKEEYDRFVKNCWDYSEIQNQLVQYEWYKNACIDEYFIKKTDRGIMAIDPAWDGADPTGIARMHSNHIGWWEDYPKQDPTQTGLLGIQRADEFNIKPQDIVVDAVGVGSGVVSTMELNKVYPDLFIGGASPEFQRGFLQTFNKRAEAHWLFREGLRKGELTITHNKNLQKQCTSTCYSTTDKVIKIEPKEKIAKKVGGSPTELDLASMLCHKYYTTGGSLNDEILSRQVNEILKGGNYSSRADKERQRAQMNLGVING